MKEGGDRRVDHRLLVRLVGKMDTDRQIHLCSGFLGGTRKELEGHGYAISGQPEKDVFVFVVLCRVAEHHER